MVGNTTSVAAGIIITQKKDGSRQGEFDGGTRRLANLQMVWGIKVQGGSEEAKRRIFCCYCT